MKALTHITVGRTALSALLVAVVLTAGLAGTVGTAAAEPMDGMGDDPFPPALYASLDGKGNDVYPPPGVYASSEGYEAITTESVSSALSGLLDGAPVALALSQDMDPY